MTFASPQEVPLPRFPFPPPISSRVGGDRSGTLDDLHKQEVLIQLIVFKRLYVDTKWMYWSLKYIKSPFEVCIWDTHKHNRTSGSKGLE